MDLRGILLKIRRNEMNYNNNIENHTFIHKKNKYFS